MSLLIFFDSGSTNKNNNVPCFIWGSAPISGTPPLVAKGSLSQSSGIPLVVPKIYTNASGNIPLFVTGVGSSTAVTGQVPLYITGPVSATNNIPLYGLGPVSAGGGGIQLFGTSILGPGTTPVGIKPPIGFSSGDLLIASVVFGLAGAAAINAPSGWVLVNSGQIQSTTQLSMWARFATNHEPSGYIFSSANGVNGTISIIIADYTGASGLPEVSNLILDATGDHTLTCSGVTTLGPNRMLVAAYANASAIAPTITQPNSMTFVGSGDASNGARSILVAQEAFAASGNTGSRDATQPTNAVGASIILAIPPLYTAKSNNIPLYILGVGPVRNSLGAPLFMAVPASGLQTQQAKLFLKVDNWLGLNTQSIPLYVRGPSGTITNIPLYTAAPGTLIGGKYNSLSCPLYIAKGFNGSTIPLFLQGPRTNLSLNAPLFVGSLLQATGKIPLVIRQAVGPVNKNMPLSLNGF